MLQQYVTLFFCAGCLDHPGVKELHGGCGVAGLRNCYLEVFSSEEVGRAVMNTDEIAQRMNKTDLGGAWDEEREFFPVPLVLIDNFMQFHRHILLETVCGSWPY